MSNELQQIINGGKLTADAVIAIKHYEKTMKEAKAEYDAFKAKLLAAMEQNNIIKIQGDGLTVSYVAPTQKETFDSKALREDNPDLYDAYVKMSPVKASVRIKAEF